jgi:hypothetical protein
LIVVSFLETWWPAKHIHSALCISNDLKRVLWRYLRERECITGIKVPIKHSEVLAQPQDKI